MSCSGGGGNFTSGGGISGLLNASSRSCRRTPSTTIAAAGGNLIWGRQLHPAILLKNHYHHHDHDHDHDNNNKKKIGQSLLLPFPLRPALSLPPRPLLCPPSASAEEGAGAPSSSGDAKVDFAAKYRPALITGFFFFMWYFLNVIFNIMNKKIYNYFPYPYFVSVIHLGVGVIYCLVSWAVGLPKRADFSKYGAGADALGALAQTGPALYINRYTTPYNSCKQPILFFSFLTKLSIYICTPTAPAQQNEVFFSRDPAD